MFVFFLPDVEPMTMATAKGRESSVLNTGVATETSTEGSRVSL